MASVASVHPQKANERLLGVLLLWACGILALALLVDRVIEDSLWALHRRDLSS